MRKIAMVSVCVGALGLFACGGSDAADAAPPDAADDGGLILPCNPVAQTGCGTNEKCTFITEVVTPQHLGYTSCWDDGAVSLGGECTPAQQSETFPAADDCEAGTYCSNGICSEICSNSPNSCDMGFCVHTVGVFEDDSIGMCNAPCDLFAQDCENEETCYLLLASGGYPAVCAPAVPEPTVNDQPDPGCVEEEGEAPQTHNECCSFINTCVQGTGCVLINPYEDGLVCAAFCDGDPDNPPGPPAWSCEDFGVMGPNDHCLPIANFYTDVPDLDQSIGFCIVADDWGPADCFNEVQDATEDGTDCCTDGGNPACPCVFSCG